MKLPRTILLLSASVALATALGRARGEDQPKPPAGSSNLTVAAVKADAAFPKVQAFVQAHCIECHGEKVQKGDVDLHGFADAASLVKDPETWEDVLDKVQAGEMPPKKKPRPNPDDLKAFVADVKGIFEEHGRNAKPDPGRVTVRRLNRAEYNNTIRDLIGVDVQPADDFPSDDVGHGFDNIGDVLSLSPVLMERYLSAAETVMQRAILPDPPKPTVRRRGGQEIEPVLRGPGSDKVRVRSTSDKGSTLAASFDLTEDGEYTVRARVYADRPDDEPVRLSISCDGGEAQTFDVTATDKSPMQCQAKFTLQPGKRRVVLTLLNPSEPKPKDEEKSAADLEKKDARDKDASKEKGKDSKNQQDKANLEKKDSEKKEDQKKDGSTSDKPSKPAKRTLNVLNIGIEGPADTRPASQRRLLAVDSNLPHDQQARQALGRFMNKAYRRPVGAEEIDRVAKLVEQAEADGQKWEAAMQTGFEAVLVSPKFLFRLELDDRPDSADAHAIDEFQLASRLSYFLWSSMPDDELLDLAGKKQLSAHLDEQVRRMLKDPKSKALVDNFAMQWLQLRRLKSFSPDTKLFPMWDERLRAAMQKETELFFQAVIQEDRSILDLIDADFTFLNERLARHYGIGDTNGNPMYGKAIGPKGDSIYGEKFVRVHLAGGTRGGVLTQGSVLAVTSNPSRTSPVKRGKFVLDQILGVPPPPPPPNVPELKADAEAAKTASLRQRMQEHRSNPACASCHEQMDAIGFAFENFDAVGAFRAKDGDFAIDPSGTLPDGSTFQSPSDLRSILKNGRKDMFARCLTKKMLTYALGRGVEYYDTPTVDKIVTTMDKDGYKFSTLVTEIAKSDPFRMRRGKEHASAASE